MGTYDRIAPLPLLDRRRRLRAHVADGLERFRARLDHDRDARRRPRGARRGHLLHAGRPRPLPGSRGARLDRLAHDRDALAAARRARAVHRRARHARRRSTTAAGRSRAPRSISRCARRAPRSARSSGASRRRCASSSRRAPTCATGWPSRPSSSSRSIPSRASGTWRTWTRWPRPAACASATSRPTTSARRSTRCRTRTSTA